MFLFHYGRSRFLECNKTSAEYNAKTVEKYQQDPIRNKRIMEGLLYITRKLESFKKTYWLTDGTLLGIINYSFSLLFKCIDNWSHHL
jgi:hypothetical protein